MEQLQYIAALLHVIGLIELGETQTGLFAPH